MPNSQDNNTVEKQNDTKGEGFTDRGARKKSKGSGRKSRSNNNNSSNAGVNLSNLN